ncbi:hypothetical protein [Hymenobacter sp. B81]|uniref:hypothetical protein n=1 Tax=Hymenobacter sp. B81 TaxID=3344878 RepID=UPI0037DC57A8
MLGLSACFWGDEQDTEHLMGRYYAVGNGPMLGESNWSNVHLYFDDEQFGLTEPILPDYVTAVFYHDSVLVAETGTLVLTEAEQYLADRQYYLVPVHPGDHSADAHQLVQGPFDWQTCLRKLRHQGLSSNLTDSARFVAIRAGR